MKRNFKSASPPEGEDEPNKEEKPKQDGKTRITPQDVVMVLVGKWAMPTTVILVLVTCLSGYFLEVEAFTAVVGMISPVIMALIMVIKDALSVDKDKRNRKKE
ncbi:hypothetical protein PA25_27600 [Pseudoalteromonas sp. A25]|uniref:hypothetical protein n=1 Tax=Pseudoalteromonas sp. A25 TaxID=116092 RepID=UPI001260C57E|nr:hypothetical protein [Pseudoalteromonas sp. A25]BBN82775.1 hypothetical protein PA25_27600 [Pseudoalteromonas sp. A25]